MKKYQYLQIFNYLKEFSKLRNKPVRDIKNSKKYAEVLWLDEVPRSSLFDNIIRSDFDKENDYWLKIKKPSEPQKPEFPALSENLGKWIVEDSLLHTEEHPLLKESIFLNNESLRLEDFPDVQSELEEYIEDEWENDLEEYNIELAQYEKLFAIYQPLNKTYKQIFKIFNKTKQFGDEFELVVGVGLINYKRDNDSAQICRHLFTQTVEINFDFEKSNSQLILRSVPGSEVKIETDSIEGLDELFDSNNIIDAEKNVKQHIESNETETLFEDNIKDYAQMFIQRCSTDGRYKESLEKFKKYEDKPTLQLSPALLLRKRDTKSLTILYDGIINEIENSPESIDVELINSLIGVETDTSEGSNGGALGQSSYEDQPIYFPKEYNDEQIEIINKSRRNKKVLVQGPPGTGKSHTIANLICHLLANGKRILITAQTKRALEVLKEKLPPDFQNLAVNFLSGDSSSLKDLEASVNAINDELAQDNTRSYSERILEAEKELHKTRTQLAITTHHIVSEKEKTINSRVFNTKYKGSLKQIAETLQADIEHHTWYNDDFHSTDYQKVLTTLEVFFDNRNHFNDLENEYSLPLPSLDKLPNVETVNRYKRGRQLIQKFQSSESDYSLPKLDYSRLGKLLNDVEVASANVNTLTTPFLEEMKIDFSAGQLRKWLEKYKDSKLELSRIEEYDLRRIDMDIQVDYGCEKSIKQLKYDAGILRNHMTKGNPLSGFGFKMKKMLLPTEVKDRLYFIDAVRVNGSSCDAIEKFDIVLRDLDLRQTIENLEETWNERAAIGSKYEKKINAFKHFTNTTYTALQDLTSLKKSSDIFYNFSNVKIDYFSNYQLNSLKEKVEYNLSNTQLEELTKVIDEAKVYLQSRKFHSITQQIIDCFDVTESNTYSTTLSLLEDMKGELAELEDYQGKRQFLLEMIPKTMELITSGMFNREDIPSLESAILFSHAQKEMSKSLKQEHGEDLFIKKQNLEKEVKKLISEIASKKAWCSVLEKLTQNNQLRKDLTAWVMAVKKIGKTGRGKRATKYKRIAQAEMNKCKDAVPCWIMPMYKVAETIQPQKGMYDYVIIDEASQLGADAVFLLYISKNVIIVGDDKQTSPEYVGVNAEQMTPHIKRHLQGIQHSEFYSPDFSFFDHARLFCDGMTVLREHFRCMPEIIEFSNKLFYKPDGKQLYPLTQYTSDRLEPLVTHFCKSGYIEGRNSTIVNKPEAEALVQKIVELTEDPRYNDKTFGVINLQGNRQSSLIENLLISTIGEKEFFNRKIVCGNSASFQGDERDVIFLSMVTAPNHNRSALTKATDERRFNVAMSRAKEQVWLFHSVQLKDLRNAEDLRYKLLDHFENPFVSPTVQKALIENNGPRKLHSQPEPFDSWFEVDVYNDFINKGYGVIPQYKVANGRYRIDLVAFLEDGTKIAIECDGDKWHGAEQYESDLRRQNVLERCGWQFFRVRGHAYYSNKEKALEPLWKILEKTTKIKETIQNVELKIKTSPSSTIERKYLDDSEQVKTNEDQVLSESYVDPVLQEKEYDYIDKKKEENKRITYLDLAIKSLKSYEETKASYTLFPNPEEQEPLLNKALEYSEKYLQSQPRDVEALECLGLATRAKGLLKKAVDIFSTAIEIDPENGIHYYHKAVILQDLNKFHEAEDCLKTAREMGCEDAAELLK